MTDAEKLIARTEKLLRKIAEGGEREFAQKIINYITKEIAVLTDGTIRVSQRNRNSINNIEQSIKGIETEIGKRLTIKVIDAVSELISVNEDYYATLEPSKRKYDALKTEAREIIKKRLGINSKGQPIKGGYIAELVRNTNISNEVKKYLYNKVILGRGRYQDTIEGVKALVEGSKNTSGIFTRHLETAVIDTFAQVDRSINEEFAKKLKLKAFVYSGGIIENSRDFCIKRNNKVFTTDEAAEWHKDKDLPLTKAEKEIGQPSGYNPLIDMGRWRCRHTARYISNERAIRLRPELKGKF